MFSSYKPCSPLIYYVFLLYTAVHQGAIGLDGKMAHYSHVLTSVERKELKTHKSDIQALDIFNKCQLVMMKLMEATTDKGHDKNKGFSMVRSPEHGNAIFGILYCRNSPENAIFVIITRAYLCSCGLKIINLVQCAAFTLYNYFRTRKDPSLRSLIERLQSQSCQ